MKFFKKHKLMMFRFQLITVLLFSSSINLHAQQIIDSVLIAIEKNNKTLLSNQQLIAANNLGYRTGNTLPNPVLEYDYLVGRPQTAGNQHDFVAVQSFSFPTVYIRKNQLAREHIKRSINEINSLRQDILLDAKLVCVQLIFHSKINKRLLMLRQQNEIILSNFEKRLQSGDGNILDVNKSRFQLIGINNQLQHNNSASTQLQQKLIELNGGVAINFRDTIYPADTLLPPFEILEKDYEKNDPLRKMLEQDVTISRKKIEVARSLSFPKMELGYHYQGILGQNFSGIHTGITIPLWENKNTVKQKKSEMSFSELSLNAHLNEHYFHIKHTYEKYLNLKEILNNYRRALLEINSPFLLEKSLTLGHISTIEYFMEMSYFNDAYNSYLDTEKEFHEVVAELLKYKL